MNFDERIQTDVRAKIENSPEFRIQNAIRKASSDADREIWPLLQTTTKAVQSGLEANGFIRAQVQLNATDTWESGALMRKYRITIASDHTSKDLFIDVALRTRWGTDRSHEQPGILRDIIAPGATMSFESKVEDFVFTTVGNQLQRELRAKLRVQPILPPNIENDDDEWDDGRDDER